MNQRRGMVLAAILCGSLAAFSGETNSQAADPVSVRPAIYQPSSAATVTAVGFHHGYRPYGGYYGGYSSGYRSYGFGYGYGSPYYRNVYFGPSYGVSVGYGNSYYSPYGPYGIYGNNYNRPYYTYPMGYYRYGYYSYPSYRMYGYPYSYNGFFPYSYYGGFTPAGGGIITTPMVAATVAPTTVTAPYVYGGYYNYPMMYGGSVYGYGCGW